MNKYNINFKIMSSEAVESFVPSWVKKNSCNDSATETGGYIFLDKSYFL